MPRMNSYIFQVLTILDFFGIEYLSQKTESAKLRDKVVFALIDSNNQNILKFKTKTEIGTLKAKTKAETNVSRTITASDAIIRI